MDPLLDPTIDPAPVPLAPEDERVEAIADTEDADLDPGTGKPVGGDDDTDLIARYEDLLDPSDSTDRELARYQTLRDYVAETAMLKDEEDAVGTNFILRFQYAQMSFIMPESPAPKFRPKRWMPPAQAQGTPMDYPDEMVRYAQTHEALIQDQQDDASLCEQIEGLIQDAMTLPIAWLKARWQEDFRRDPIGFTRNNDVQDALAEYQALARKQIKSVADEKRMEVLRDTVAAAERTLIEADLAAAPPMTDPVIDPMTGALTLPPPDPRVLRLQELDAGSVVDSLPEVAVYRGWTFSTIRPEDMRVDRRVTKPEDIRHANWIAHRAWMTGEEIRTKWGLDDDQFLEYASSTGDHKHARATVDTVTGPGGSDEIDPEEDTKEVFYSVWELWDRVSGKVFVWCEGARRFLDQYVPAATGTRFFPFFPLVFNRVTGRLAGPSDTDLCWALQDEINLMRTHEREARKSAHPRFIVKAGTLKPGEKRKLEEALPYSITEVEAADEVAKSVMPITPPAYNAALYDISKALIDLQTMAGLPLAATGVAGGAKLATEAAIAREGFSQQNNARQKTVMRLLKDLYLYMAQVNAQVLTPEEVAAKCGPGAFWPLTDRQRILSDFTVDIDSTLTNTADRRKELEDWKVVTEIAMAMGLPFNPIELTKELLALMGKRVALERFVLDPATLQALRGAGIGPGAGAAPAGPGAPGPGGMPAGGPEDQGGQGDKGGNPGMSSPPAPADVPNSPVPK
jgi:hypothetical protein